MMRFGRCEYYFRYFLSALLRSVFLRKRACISGWTRRPETFAFQANLLLGIAAASVDRGCWYSKTVAW